MVSDQKQGRLHRWKLRLSALLIGVLVATLVAEIALRLLAPQVLSPLLAWVEKPGFEDMILADDTLGWRMAPGYDGQFARGTHVTINSLGLRDHEYGAKKPQELRVLSLGDSYAFGHGVELEQTYAKRLEVELRERIGNPHANVISAGVDGYNTQQVTKEFQRLLPLLEPDFVITTFVAGNDVAENAIFAEQLRTRLQSPVGPIGSNSHVARLLLRVSFGPRFFMANRNQSNIEHTIECYRVLEKTLKTAHIPFLVLIIPARHQIDPSVHAGASCISKIGATGYLMRNNRRIIEHFIEADVPYIDLFSVLANKEQPTYFDDDPHTDAYGHDLIATAIAERLASTLMSISHPNMPDPNVPEFRATSLDSDEFQ